MVFMRINITLITFSRSTIVSKRTLEITHFYFLLLFFKLLYTLCYRYKLLRRKICVQLHKIILK